MSTTPIFVYVSIVAASIFVLGLFYVACTACSDWLHARYGEEPSADGRPHLTVIEGYREPYDWKRDPEFDPWKAGA